MIDKFPARHTQSSPSSLAKVLRFTALFIVLFVPSRKPTAQPSYHRDVLVERKQVDWDHSGHTTNFSLFRSPETRERDAADRLVIDIPGQPSWTLVNHDDVWAPLAETHLRAFQNQKSRLYFISSTGNSPQIMYLLLKGADSGCCDGSLTILAPSEDGKPRVIFKQPQYLLMALTPGNDGAIEIIGKSSSSEARAAKNAESYDPFRIYVLRGSQPAQYSAKLSQDYSEKHYCKWHGSTYDERFVAVGPPTGASHCSVLSEQAFQALHSKQPQLFGDQ